MDGKTCLSVRAARWTRGQKPIHAPYWSIEREASLPDGWIAAIRLAEHNKTVLDYVFLPTGGKVKRTIRFSEAARARRGIQRFKTATGLVRAIARKLVKARRTGQAALRALGKRSTAPRPNTRHIHERS